MREHREALQPLNIYHKEDFDAYCDMYEKSPPGKLPMQYWSDDCAIAALSVFLNVVIIEFWCFGPIHN